MPKQDSLCLRCRSHIHLRYRSYNYQKKPIVSTLNVCKKGLYQHYYQHYFDRNPHILSCSEFDNINPGVIIDACPSRIKGGLDSFIVRVIGEVDDQLLTSFENAMKAAAELLKKELIKHRGDSHTKT